MITHVLTDTRESPKERYTVSPACLSTMRLCKRNLASLLLELLEHLACLKMKVEEKYLLNLLWPIGLGISVLFPHQLILASQNVMIVIFFHTLAPVYLTCLVHWWISQVLHHHIILFMSCTSLGGLTLCREICITEAVK